MKELTDNPTALAVGQKTYDICTKTCWTICPIVDRVSTPDNLYGSYPSPVERCVMLVRNHLKH